MNPAQNSPRHDDELTRRYREASAQDPARPSPQVRDAVRAHAQMVLASRQAAVGQTAAVARPAANQSRWKLSLLASIAVFGLTGLLFLQFERSSPEEKELAFGQPSPTAANAEKAGAVTAVPPAATPAPGSATPGSRSEPKARASGDTAAKQAAAPAASMAGIATTPAVREKSGSPDKAAPAQDQAIKENTAPEPKTDLAKAAPERSAEHRTAEATPAPAPSQHSAGQQAQANPPPPASPAAAAPTVAAESARQADSANTGQSTGAIAQAPLPAPPHPPLLALPPPLPPAPAPAPAPAPVPPPAMAPPPPAPAAAPAVAASPASKNETSSPAPTPPARARLAQPQASLKSSTIALHQAARQGNVSQIESLVKQGAAVNAPDEAGRTPLMLAVISGQTAAVRRLLALGANPALTDRDGLNALQYAQRLGMTGISRLLQGAS